MLVLLIRGRESGVDKEPQCLQHTVGVGLGGGIMAENKVCSAY